MEERLEIDEHRELARRNDVLVVEVSCVQRIENRDERSEPFVEALDLGPRGAWRVGDVLTPAVLAACDCSDCSKRRRMTACVDPLHELVEMEIDCQRAGLEDDASSR